MKKLCLFAAAAALAMPTVAFAQTGNGAPSGPHYNLNIIGVDNPKTATLTSSDRHTIFVALTGQSKIFLTQGDFAVCDGNAFDAAFDCSGNQVQAQGAVFQLPCNTNLTDDVEGDLIPCGTGDTASYSVYARALGKPGGNATMTTCATDPNTGEVVCSAESTLLVRNKGKSSFTNVTNQLTSLVVDLNGDGKLDRVSLFAGGLEDWFWQYDNNHLRLAQLRFYLN